MNWKEIGECAAIILSAPFWYAALQVAGAYERNIPVPEHVYAILFIYAFVAATVVLGEILCALLMLSLRYKRNRRKRRCLGYMRFSDYRTKRR